MKDTYGKKIVTALAKAGKKGLFARDLAKACHVFKKEKKAFGEEIALLKKEGRIVTVKDKLVLSKLLGAYPAVIVRLNRTFGFARPVSDEQDVQDVFIPGKFLKGALTGDKVLVRPARSPRGDSPEGEVYAILEEGFSNFTGAIVKEEGKLCILPDSFARFPIALEKGENMDYREGDKVSAQIVHRGGSHRDHRAKVLMVYGDAQNAAACAQALVESEGVPVEFPEEVLAEAREVSGRGIKDSETARRLDLRPEIIFTIDSAESKDLDDAISLRKMGDVYQLGVHIADVSHYVRGNSALDKEAFARGTSVYYADQVIPMLPKELSNGICSLNPGEDRLAFSALITLDQNGKMLDFDFRKSVINSRVKGVYKEINQILNKTESDEIRQKYEGLYDTIFLMKELADKLIAGKTNRGAPALETSESKIILENGVAVDIVPRQQGESEEMIEVFMLQANEAAATLATMQGLPFVYRVHEDPSMEKIDGLRQTMAALGIDTHGLTDGKNPRELADLLRQVKGTPLFEIVNRTVLRSMAKAKYSTDPIGHYGLVLKNYAHFTSPIRRYPDLTIHRILSDFLSGGDKNKIKKRYEKFVERSAAQSTQTEIAAVKIERGCEDFYKAEYMKPRVGEEFDGVITSAVHHGIYVELPNTVEGLVKTEELPDGEYEYDGMMELRCPQTGRRFRVGDPVRVRCVKADVNLGQVDFVLV